MNSLKLSSALLILIVSLSGCVSKKKYMAMVDSKDKFQEEAKKMKAENNSLRGDLKTAENDFKAMKDQLYASDAVKNDQLEKLQNDLNKLEESYNLIKTDLSKSQTQMKDQRYFNAKASSEIARLEIEVKQLARDTASINYSLKLARQRVEEYKQRSEEKTDKLNEKNLEISELKTAAGQKDAELAQIQASVDAEKQKLDAINKSFIALRRQLVRAKGEGAPLDPNNNTNINEISKQLGH